MTTSAADAIEPIVERGRAGRSGWLRGLTRLLRDPQGLAGVVLVGALVLMALLAPVLSWHPPDEQFRGSRLVAPSANPISPNTRQAAGIEYRFWSSKISLCGDSPAARMPAIRSRNSGTDISRRPFETLPETNTPAGLMLSTRYSPLATTYPPLASAV